jgi:RNA polymerase sigma-70 factor (ECF subfamily)
MTAPAADPELIERANLGDREAFGQLALRHEKGAYAAALSIVRDPQTALDVVQESFLKAYRELKSLRHPDRFAAWLHCIVRGRALDALSLRRRQNRAASAPPRASASENERVREAIDRLPEHYRTAVLAHFMEGLTYEEVASMLGVPLSTVQGRLYKARKLLRELLR